MSISLKTYQNLYQQSISDPETFWATQAKQFISWSLPWKTLMRGTFDSFDVQWFVEAKLNACYNCLDRHLPKDAHKIALIWEGNNPNETRTLSYKELYQEVCKFANALKKLGIQKGDRICIYLPMIPEVVIAMLACARIGAIHSVVFSGFSAESLKTRMLDANCALLITADEAFRGEKMIPLKQHADEAFTHCPNIKKMIVVKRSHKATIPWDPAKDCWYHELIADAEEDCPMEMMDAGDPLFILYTSGSTGKPKGVVHSTGGYLLYAAMTHYYLFDYKKEDIYWCTADVGWITGHSYVVYGPLSNGASCFIYEGIPNYPTASRCWNMIDKYQISIFYTSPTQIRALRSEGDAWVTNTKRTSLRLLGTVGEPINPEVWNWYFKVVGSNNCPIVDTWWQTETGGILISPLPNKKGLKPGSAGLPFFGIVPDIVDEKGRSQACNVTGKLVIKQPWPGMMQTIYGDRQRFRDSYFKEIPGTYCSGDGAYRDKDGYFWISGRLDDVIKVSGHRLGTGELESALLQHSAVAEAAVVGIPDPIRGEAIVAFISLKHGIKENEALKQEMIQMIVKNIGAIAKPKTIEWAPALPKTRSGKIMRRVLRKIANHDFEDLGDLSTLVDPGVIEVLKANTR